MFSKILFLLFVNTVSSIESYPFNSTLCVECIKRINYIHSHNKTIENISKGINNFCKENSIQGCEVLTSKGEKWIMEDSVKVCEKLNYCDYISLENMIFDLYALTAIPFYKNVYIYRYYDIILAIKQTNNIENDTMNFNQLWSAKIDEPYQNIEIFQLTNQYITSNYPSYLSYSCYKCQGYGTYMLKVDTKNHIYYINITNGIIESRFDIQNNQNLPYKFYYTVPTNQNSIFNYVYNSTLYYINSELSVIPSTCNYTNPSSGTSSTFNCLYTSIESNTLEPIDLIYPEEKPRCGLALEMYCPHNFKCKEDCLNCVIKNQNIFSTCTISEEENWCNYLS